MGSLLQKVKVRASFYQRLFGIKLFAIASALNGACFLDERKLESSSYLFVLAHPRSGSTLLGHLLMSHPEILGYGENHVGYEDPEDLYKLACRTTLKTGDRTLSQKFLMDKLVWPRYVVGEAVRRRENAKFIMICRDPEPTFASMQRVRPDWKDGRKCLQTYTECLNWLEMTAKAVNDPKRCFLTSYAILLKNPERVLAQATDFLQLEDPLTTEYRVTATTGNFRFGDNSDNIKAGKIVRRHDHTESHFAEDIVDPAKQRYRRFLSSMEAYATIAS